VDSVSLQDGGTGSPLLRSPLPFRSLGEWKGTGGEGTGASPPFLSRSVGEEGGLGGKVRAPAVLYTDSFSPTCAASAQAEQPPASAHRGATHAQRDSAADYQATLYTG
jgi:hypothetical protein